MSGVKAFAAPLFGVVLLVSCYVILAEWGQLPGLISSTIEAVHWPP
jgi:hypothetical protein